MEQVRPGLWALAVPAPGGARIPYVFVWILQSHDGTIDLVDAGYDTPLNRDLLAGTFDAIGARLDRIRRIVLTHLHPDHTGLATWLRRDHGAELVMSRTEVDAYARFGASADPSAVLRWGVPEDQRRSLRASIPQSIPTVPVDREVEDGDVVAMGDGNMRVVLTPGHTRGHIVLVDESNQQIYTGDHVLPTMHPGIGIGGAFTVNPVDEFISSCAAMQAFSEYEALPGHGYRFRGVADRASAAASHHLRRVAELRAVLIDMPAATVWQVAERLTWRGGWDALDDQFKYTALRQVEVFRDYASATP